MSLPSHVQQVGRSLLREPCGGRCDAPAEAWPQDVIRAFRAWGELHRTCEPDDRAAAPIRELVGSTWVRP